MKLKVGDRVKVYGDATSMLGGKFPATVRVVSENEAEVCVEIDSDAQRRFWVWAAQCRRLKPKAPRRRVWIFGADVGNENISASRITFGPIQYSKSSWVEFIEVRRKT